MHASDPFLTTPLPTDLSAARHARRFLQDTFRQFEQEVPFDLLLIASELATNAVLHGTPPVELRLRIHESTIHIALADGGPGDPVARAFTDDLGGGRGLSIVESLASAWGVDTRGPGKQVWAELPLRALADEPPTGGRERREDANSH